MAEPAAAADVALISGPDVFNYPMPPIPADAEIIPKEDLGELNTIPTYDILNGNVEDVVPYLLTATISPAYHWAVLNGASPSSALRCLDGFIKTALFVITTNQPAGWNPAQVRMAAIILGTARAVITANYNIGVASLVPGETTNPVLFARVPVDPATAVSYTVLVAANTQHRALLTTALNLTPIEKSVIKVVLRSAQAIIPIQGLNLITDGHHYLSDKTKQSFKSFQAVERQVWVPTDWKGYTEGHEEMVRDILWHKAGHPVSVHIKEAAATSPAVKTNLMAAKLGSATARLPALETEARAASTYVRVMSSVDVIWGTMGGACDGSAIQERLAVLNGISRVQGDPPLNPPITLPGANNTVITINNRKAALDEVKRVVEMNATLAALAYGFYCGMMDTLVNESTQPVSDTLRNAFSLKKLMSNETAAYAQGHELYRDFRAAKAAARTAGKYEMPRMWAAL